MKKNHRPIKVVVAAIALAAAAAVVWSLLPNLVIRRAVDEARARGIALTIGEVTLGLRSLTFGHLHATAVAAPRVAVDVGSAKVELRGLTPTELVLSNPVVTIDGLAALAPLLEMSARLSKAGTADAATAVTPAPAKPARSSIERVTVVDARVVLHDVAPANGGARMVARAIHGDIRREPDDAAVGGAFGVSGEVLILSNRDAVLAGPWRFEDHKAAGTEGRFLDLAPSAPGTAFVRRSTTADGSARVVATIRQKKLSELVSFELPFAPATAVLDLDLTHQSSTAPRVSGQLNVSISRFVIAGAATPAPLRASFAYEGRPENARVTNGTFAFGPFQGTLGGSLDFVAGAKGKLELSSTKVPCATLARSLAEQALPGVSAALGAFGLDGPTKQLVKGEVGFEGELTFDVLEPGQFRISPRPVGSCSVDIPLFPKGLVPVP